MQTVKGVQVGYTLSMTLEKKRPKRKKFYLILLAFSGVISSIFTFLTMFTPMYSLPVLLTAITVIFVFFCYNALKPEHSLLPVLGAVLVYCLLFFKQRERITNGLMYLTNHICQAIYMTDWEYFTTDTHYTEAGSVTCVLCFLIFPIIWMICYAVLRYQNFFLSFLVTFPFIEIGLFFGIVPDHTFAAGMVAFWFAMLAVQMAGSGVTQNVGKTGFFRRKNTFLPVSGMRFMMPESTGILVLLFLMLLFSGIEFLLTHSGYERSEQVKTMRTNFQNYVASLHLSDHPFLEDYGNAEEFSNDTTNILLGSTEEKIYENLPVTSIVFSENPETRIYLKYRTGHIYNGRNWTILPEESYSQEEFNYFEKLNYYPPEFLYYTIPTDSPVSMSLYHTTGILSQCIPYGFQPNRQITCQKNEMIQSEITGYTIQGKIDYEAFFANPENTQALPSENLLASYSEKWFPVQNFSEHPLWVAGNHSLLSNFYNGDLPSNEQTLKACLLCGSFYEQFVRENYLTLPDNAAMQAVREAFSSQLENFQAETATPAETIQKLQELRNSICSQVTYSLTPGKTPPNADHVEYFLLENQKGYCEHYATAGTVLARMAGIPARYCEGYMIDCSREGTLQESETENGNIAYTSEILDSNAHAWTEIYLNGIGWIPFEFTFSYFTPTPVASPEVPETVTSTSENTVTETSSFTTSPETEKFSNSTPVPDTEPKKIPEQLLICIIFLTVAAIGCVFVLIFRIIRLTAVRKRQQLLAQPDKKEAAFCAYQYLTQLLSECDVPTQGITIGEIVEQSELYCTQYMPSDYSLSAAVQIGAKLRYSPHPMSKGELHYLSQTATALAEGMYQQAGLFRKFYLKWLRHYV